MMYIECQLYPAKHEFVSTSTKYQEKIDEGILELISFTRLEKLFNSSIKKVYKFTRTF